MWSAPNHKALLGVCVKFVDPDGKGLLQALLALSELPGLDGPGSHGGMEQWKLLRRTLDDYNVWHKIGFYTGDNHGSNDKLCRLLGEHLNDMGIAWDPRKQRIRCHGHVINLAVQAFLFVDSKEASRAAVEQIEDDDEAAFNSDFLSGVQAHKALGWRRLGRSANCITSRFIYETAITGGTLSNRRRVEGYSWTTTLGGTPGSPF